MSICTVPVATTTPIKAPMLAHAIAVERMASQRCTPSASPLEAVG
jgi:hypothetical protein